METLIFVSKFQGQAVKLNPNRNLANHFMHGIAYTMHVCTDPRVDVNVSKNSRSDWTFHVINQIP